MSTSEFSSHMRRLRLKAKKNSEIKDMPELCRELRTCPCFTVASPAGNSLLEFLWNEYERKKTGEDEKSEGGRGEEEGKGGGVAYQIWTCSIAYCTLWTLSCTPGPLGNNSFKDIIFKLQNYRKNCNKTNVTGTQRNGSSELITAIIS